ncbi:LuxR C-terminal-related transcriptional regulator [Streptomyces sp. T028]
MSNRQIAARLVLSLRTVDFHVGNIRTKLDFGTRAQIAGWWVATQRRTE